MTIATSTIDTARAEALFASTLTTGSRPDPKEAARAIRGAIRRYGGIRGCVAEMAAAYGEHPETAARRMGWARSVVDDVLHGGSRPQ